MELKEAQEIAELLRTQKTKYLPPTHAAIMALDDRITELEALRDELVGLCKEAVTFPAEYRKHRILLQQLRERIKDE